MPEHNWDEQVDKLMGHMVIEEGHSSLSAFIPGVRGVVVHGETEAEIHKLMAEALRMHLETS